MKKDIQLLQITIDTFGYWSNEVYNLNNYLLQKHSLVKYYKIQNSIKK